ncbi:hypothetical protein D9615_001679 [Tricholomella constricta]|uniref:UFSP1/2/DUB catalytic domain-containing protein n=1 Tax=Tricholomella constricta TaxID=117010 RepID=A0A8H5HPH1_9AGAR|nr:hypothetical protein D9615_001679 [Tricholomella constricta]
MSFKLCDEKLFLDPEIETIGTSSNGHSSRDVRNSNGGMDCSFCSLNLDKLSLPQRQEHYEQHIEDDSQGLSSSLQRGGAQIKGFSMKKITASPMKLLGTHGKEKQTETTNDDDIFWYPALSISPPSNYTPGLIPLLKKALSTSHANDTTRRAALCYQHSVHVSRGSWDKSWGCGYRNFLMVCTALMEQKIQPKYVALLTKPVSPGIRNLQVWIEDAWKAGFDKEGAKQLKNLVHTKRWIGTADLWVAFIYRGIPAELVDFDLKNQPRGVEVVIDWIVDYFSPKLSPVKSANVNDVLRGASPVVITDCMPIILQHDGHSRTIVGYEVGRNGKATLLTFDPATVLNKDIHDIATSSWPHCTSSPSPRTPVSGPSNQPRKRPSGSPPPTTRPSTKRARFSTMDLIHLDDNGAEVFVVTDSQDSQLLEEPRKPASEMGGAKLRQLLERVRLDTKKLGKKKEYQILYFPMTAPLTERARLSHPAL